MVNLESNSVKTFVIENIKFYIIKKGNDFYISRKEVYQFFKKDTSVALKNLFNIKKDYPNGDISKIEDVYFMKKDNGDKGEKISNAFLKIKDLIEVIDFYSDSNVKYSKKFFKFKSYLQFMDDQFNLMGDKFDSDLDIYYRLKYKMDNKLEYYYIAKPLQSINTKESSKTINVFQMENGDLAVEISNLIENIGYYLTVYDKEESSLSDKAISIKGEFSGANGKCFLDNETIVHPIAYVTFNGLERFFSRTLPQLYLAYRKWYESIVSKVFPNANEVRRISKDNQVRTNFNIPSSVAKATRGRVLMKDDIQVNHLCNKKESFQIDDKIYEEILQIYETAELKSIFKTSNEFINSLLKQSLNTLRDTVQARNKEIEELEDKLSEAKSSRAKALKNLIKI